MPRYNAPFEIHVHGDVPLRADVTFVQIQEALKPIWAYAGARSLAGRDAACAASTAWPRSTCTVAPSPGQTGRETFPYPWS